MKKILVSFLAIGQSLGITWTRIGCDDAWLADHIDAQGGPMTIDPDAVWANAVALSKGAREAIASLSGYKPFPREARKNAGASANFIWNTEFAAHRGLASSSEGDMDEVTSVYRDIESALAGTLQVSTAQPGYLFCGGRELTKDRVPGIRDDPVWYATVTEAGEGGRLGTTDYIIPRVFEGAQTKPCKEEGSQAYFGKTFYGKKAGSGPEEEILGIVLCPNHFKTAGLRGYATLDEGYATEAMNGNKKPYVAYYHSLSGTLLHDMVHVVGHARDPRPPPAGGCFRDQYKLARGVPTDPSGNPDKAAHEQMLHNPDGYRLFAEMCRSPDTAWGYPDAPPA
ncbi:hypothetical protein AUP68_08545 [Ilyonectria robusta]